MHSKCVWLSKDRAEGIFLSPIIALKSLRIERRSSQLAWLCMDFSTVFCVIAAFFLSRPLMGEGRYGEGGWGVCDSLALSMSLNLL